MPRSDVPLTGRERHFEEDELIVSKTDPLGRITYANDVFLRISGYDEADLLGKPHSIIRHPAMPRCIFYYMWQRIQAGEEIFAYVVNRSREGDHYWVFAHVTPTLDAAGRIIGYHSNRRVPRRDAVAKAEALYGDLRVLERRAADRDKGMQDAFQAMQEKIAGQGIGYDEFIFRL
jgi:PAS domain S-box-containing protein